MEEIIRILILEDDITDLELYLAALQKANIKFEHLHVETEDGFRKGLLEFKPDIILSDYMLPQFTGIKALKIAKEISPLIPFIIVTGSINEEVAVGCMKAGASDYIIKDHLSHLVPAIHSALEKRALIFARKQAEEIITQQNKQLKELNATKDKFFSIIAHDLRSPFHGFINLTEMISENINRFSTDELVTLTHEMSQSAKNLFNLLQNLLEWSQFQKGSISFTPQVLSLSVKVTKCIEQINQTVIQKRITIINEISENQEIFADEIMVNSIISNLLSNSVKFTHRDGTVTIRAKKTDDQMVEISITDSGIGMPKCVMEKLFMIGEKTSRHGTDGELSTGLGLLLCKEFVEKNGGGIWAESEEGIGSTFYFTLPSSTR